MSITDIGNGEGKHQQETCLNRIKNTYKTKATQITQRHLAPN